ncbi:malonyl-[acyl-carrier protein] O-methyltransferase [Betaproteobacteria bacterium]|nr:malonyl-[acyl-carrier protein] O-methyltransferase [Betaproteobacteria bacterium]GHT99163.1 malonyl-[acyl-carrier protein] O-methyltransferase [Betaproteobacteria bacterium]GHU21463.1 malonyl-[acyl-carrier protein] O-methyltransferase [Betaproteobacteria bacterium]
MNGTPEHYRHAVRRSFDRAAPTYDAAAHVQREAMARLCACGMAQAAPLSVRRIVDAGCGTGQALPWLGAHFPSAQLFALDFAPAMLDKARAAAPHAHPICADIERLPFADRSVDLYYSNLAAQWCEPARVLSEIARVLAPGGAAWVATLGRQTLCELHTAFASVDRFHHVMDFVDDEDWRAGARTARLDIVALRHELFPALAPDLRTLLADIKAIGAHTVGAGQRRRALGRRGWQTLLSAYETFRRPDGLLPATYDLILIILKKP